MEDRVVLVTGSRDSADNLIRLFRNNPEFDGIRIWAEDWPPRTVRLVCRCTEQQAKDITAWFNKFLGLA